jgi:hypothetical protein
MIEGPEHRCLAVERRKTQLDPLQLVPDVNPAIADLSGR